MIRPLRVAVLSLCWAAAAACGFDSNGLATGSNSAGSLESTAGSESGEGDDNSTTTPATTTSASGPSTMSSTTSDDSTTMPPATTAPGETGSSDTGDVSETTANESEGSTGAGESSTGVPSESSESGDAEAPYYGNCDDDSACGPDGTCIEYGLQPSGSGDVCYLPCDEGNPCPTPDTGDSEVICTTSGCALDCYMHDCPDGMVCGYGMSMGNWIARCVWED